MDANQIRIQARADAKVFASEFPGETLGGSDWDSAAWEMVPLTVPAQRKTYGERLNLSVSKYGADAVVADEQTMWTADTEELETELAKESTEETVAEAYEELCSQVSYLRRTEPERHHRAVEMWRAESHCQGNWT